MKNFDQARLAKRAIEDDRTFVLHDETFVAKAAVHPDVLAAYDDISEDTSSKESLDIIDEVVLGMLDERDDAAGRYRAIRADTDPATLITVEDLRDLVKWLIEVQTGRPTGPPGASSPGDKSTATASRAASSSPVAAVA